MPAGEIGQFWPVKRVAQEVGFSITEVYRQQRAGTFPKSRPYRDNPQRRFWLSSEVDEWKRSIIQYADEFDGLLG